MGCQNFVFRQVSGLENPGNNMNSCIHCLIENCTYRSPWLSCDEDNEYCHNITCYPEYLAGGWAEVLDRGALDREAQPIHLYGWGQHKGKAPLQLSNHPNLHHHDSHSAYHRHYLFQSFETESTEVRFDIAKLSFQFNIFWGKICSFCLSLKVLALVSFCGPPTGEKWH